MNYNGKEFKQYDEMYSVSDDGDVYSSHKDGLLKHAIDKDGYHRVDIHGRHMKVHKLVYLTWGGAIPNGMQINHADDNKNNNHIANLYLGTQKKNIDDCLKNGHRVGNIHSVTIYDRCNDAVIMFPSVRDFITYSGRSSTSGSFSKIKGTKWFNNRFTIIEKKGVSTIESYKSIRAMYDGGVENKAEMHEASRVGESLSLPEAQGA